MKLDGGVLVAGVVTAGVFVIGGAMAYETWALATGRAPLTWYTRMAARRWPLWTNIGTALLAALWAHFIWDRSCK